MRIIEIIVIIIKIMLIIMIIIMIIIMEARLLSLELRLRPGTGAVSGSSASSRNVCRTTSSVCEPANGGGDGLKDGGHERYGNTHGSGEA